MYLSCYLPILYPLAGRGGEADQQECGGSLLPATRGETRCQWASGGEEWQKVAFHGVGSLEEFLQSAATLARKEILWWQGTYWGLDQNDINDVIFKIGLYFAWLGFYNQMLIFPALFGLFVFLYGIVTMNMKTVNYPGSEVCHNETMKSTVLCPECPENCDFRSAKTSTAKFLWAAQTKKGTACKLV